MESSSATDVFMDASADFIAGESSVDTTGNDSCDVPELYTDPLQTNHNGPVDKSVNKQATDGQVEEHLKKPMSAADHVDLNKQNGDVVKPINGKNIDTSISQTVGTVIMPEQETNGSNNAIPSDNLDNLSCGICFQHLKVPKLLPCLHSFCLSCLEKIQPPVEVQEDNLSQDDNANQDGKIDKGDNSSVSKGDNSLSGDVSVTVGHTAIPIERCQKTSKNNSSQKSVSIQCPSCHEKIEIPPKGVVAFPTNTFLVNILKATEKLAQKGQCEICQLRDILEEAVAFCSDCSDMLCKSCWQSHSFTRFTLTHKIIPLEEMQNHAMDDIYRNRSISNCVLHTDEVLKYFCSDCSCLICRECLLLSHQGHSCESSSTAAEGKRKEFNSLLYGFKERLDSLKKDESQEYYAQIEKIPNVEDVQVQKINQFCSMLTNAVENERQNIVDKIKSEFRKIKTQCENRLASFQIIEEKMMSIVSVVNFFKQQASSNEFLNMEPFMSQRLVHLINRDVKPNPTSWYTFPEATEVNPIQISCQGQNVNLSLFKTSASKQEFEPTDSIPSQGTLADLVGKGNFKSSVTLLDKETAQDGKTDAVDMAGVKSKLSKDQDFVDATIWPKISTNKNLNQKEDKSLTADTSESDWTDSTTDEPVPGQQPSPAITKKKRGRRGGKKHKAKREVVDLQNIFHGTSLQNKGIISQPVSSPRGYLNASPPVSVIYDRKQETDQGSSNYGNIFGNPHYGMAYGSPFVSGMGAINPQVSMAYEVPMPNFSQAVASTPQPKSSSQFLGTQTKSQQQTKDSSKVSKTGAQPEEETSSASSTVPSKVISLQPKWRLDVKLSSDIYEPNLKGVFCLAKSSIIVSDSKNSKVKTFSSKGEFLRSIDVKYVNRAIFTANILIISAKNKVWGKKEDGNNINPLVFDNTPNCFISWFPKGHILAANDNKIRQYSINTTKDHFVKTKSIGVQGGAVKQIVDIRCDMQGQKIVVVDSSTKSVIICDLEGQLQGSYKDEENSRWNPTSACFDKKGYVFVTDGGGNRLVFLSPKGEYIQQWDTCPTINKPTFVTTNQTQPLYLTGHDRYVHVYDYKYL